MIELNFPNPVTHAVDLFDRKVALNQIRRTLIAPGGQAIAIIGERVTGKTSLLNIIKEWVEQEGKATVLWLPHAYSRDEFAAEIMQGICFEVGLSLRETGLINSDGEFSLMAIREFEGQVQRMLQDRPDLRFVLLLDELDSLIKNCDEVSETVGNQILHFINYLIEKTNLPIRFVFTTTLITERMKRSYESTFFSSATLIELNLWSFAEIGAFLDWLFGQTLTFDRAAQEKLYLASGGHPYFSKAILHTLLDQNEDWPAGACITGEAMEAAVEAAVHSKMVDYTLSNLWQAHFTPLEHQLLLNVSAAGKFEPIGSDNQAFELVRELCARGYMARNGEDCYLRIGLLGRWVAQKYPEVIFRPPAINPAQPPAISTGTDHTPPIVVDDLHKRVYLGEVELDLTPQEYQLLDCLAIKAGQVVSRDELAEIIWPKDNHEQGISDSRIDAALARLRRKLGEEARDYLKTVRGRGFLLAEESVRYIPADPSD